MHSSEFEREARALARRCVQLKDTGEEYAAVWGGRAVAPAPAGPYRHWLSVDARYLPEPRTGVLSVFTNEEDRSSGAAVFATDARLPHENGRVRLYAAGSISLPPIDAVFAFGGPPVKKWLESLGWSPSWGYNGNFPAPATVEGYERAFQQACPLYTGDAHAVLGGWHIPWPDGDWAELANATLLACTFADAEPWVEVWTDDNHSWVRQRVT